MKKYSKQDQRLLATCAADYAERVLPFFEKAYPKDGRSRKAIEDCRIWVRTGVFKISDICGTSLAAHAATREAKENNEAYFTAHAAGQVAATAHIPQHAFRAACYALKTITAINPDGAGVKTAKEHNWKSRHLPKHLRQEFLDKVKIQRCNHEIFIKLQKGKDF